MKSKYQNLVIALKRMGVKYEKTFHEVDSQNRTIELHMELKKGKIKMEFFMSLDTEWCLARHECYYEGRWKRFKSLEEQLNYIKARL